MELKRLKVITGYTQDAKFFSEIGDDILGYLPKQPQIPSPYAYSPSHCVYSWNGNPVIHVETKHRRYEVFMVPNTEILKTDEEATAKYLNH